MSFGTLAIISAIALLGPLLALPQRWRLPVMFGELLGGLILGRTAIGILDAGDPTFAFFANIGFALVMFVAGTHVPVRDPRLHRALRVGVLRAAAVGGLAVGAGILIERAFQTGHAGVYAVVLASSSAALVVPMVQSLGLAGPELLRLLPQVAVADVAGIVALQVVLSSAHAGRTIAGAAAVLAVALALLVVLRYLEQSGLRKRVHRLSQQRKFALEMRVNLAILFALCALAVANHLSVLLAGFSFGIAVAAVGEPRRLARQLFALTEGFLGPLFFVWLGASLDFRAVIDHPSFILLGLALGIGAVAVHASMRLTGQPLAFAGLASAQLGIPVAAATIGTQQALLTPGEGAALILGAIVTLAAAVMSSRQAARRGLVRASDGESI